jgi:uncharacterized HAD superfamily protein
MNIPLSEFAFDFDGVVADTFRLFVRMANSDYNYKIDYDSITEYEFLKVVNMERQHAMDIIEILTNEPHNIDLRPNKGAVDVLTRMAMHIPLLCVTARPFGDPIKLWFEKHLPGIEQACLKVEAAGVNTGKLDILKNNKVNYFIDDRLDTCHLLHEAGITPIVYNQPWNKKPHPFLCVDDWVELSALIDWNGSELNSPCANRSNRKN